MNNRRRYDPMKNTDVEDVEPGPVTSKQRALVVQDPEVSAAYAAGKKVKEWYDPDFKYPVGAIVKVNV